MSNILDPIRFPLHGTRLIEASAGTGKTYTLAALYVRLVLGHGESSDSASSDAAGRQRSLLPPDILVVTFTEAATRELRDRIRARLAQAALCFAGRQQADDNDVFLRSLLEEYPVEEHPACAARLDAAAQWMDEAAIYTIHGLCNRMLRQHAFDSGSLFTLELNQNEQSLREQACADYWRSFFYGMGKAETEALINQWPTPVELLKAVRPILDKQHHFAKDERTPEQIIQQVMAERAAILNELKQRWGSWITELSDLFEDAWSSERLKKSKPSNRANIRNWLEKIINWSQDNDLDTPDLTDTFFQRINFASLSEASDKIDDIIQHPAIAAVDELKDISAQLPHLLPILLPHAGYWISARLDQYKRQHGMIGYDDMLTRLRDALLGQQGPRLAQVIRQQFPVAMIDEFQDTDPVQYEVFSTLYLNQPGTTWLMIGDPKQAIYAFRGADIHTYLAAKQANQESLYTLATNFRSTKGLVEAANHLFGYASKYEKGSFLYQEIPFAPVQANDRHERLLIDNKPADAMTLWQIDGRTDSDATDPSMSKGQYIEEMAQRSASEIVRLLNLAETGRCGFEKEAAEALAKSNLKVLRAANIAILVRDGREAAAMRNALSQRGLRSVYLSDKDSVFEIGRASCREREKVPVVAVALTQKRHCA